MQCKPIWLFLSATALKNSLRVGRSSIEQRPQDIRNHLARFPLGRMYGDHVFVLRGDEIEIQTTMRVEGPLRLLWVKLVAEGVARKLAAQTEELISRARAA